MLYVFLTIMNNNNNNININDKYYHSNNTEGF